MTARTETARTLPKLSDVLPKERGLYYDGRWQEPAGGYLDTWNPGTGESLGRSAQANAQDVGAAARAAASTSCALACADLPRLSPVPGFQVSM